MSAVESSLTDMYRHIHFVAYVRYLGVASFVLLGAALGLLVSEQLMDAFLVLTIATCVLVAWFWMVGWLCLTDAGRPFYISRTTTGEILVRRRETCRGRDSWQCEPVYLSCGRIEWREPYLIEVDGVFRSRVKLRLPCSAYPWERNCYRLILKGVEVPRLRVIEYAVGESYWLSNKPRKKFLGSAELRLIPGDGLADGVCESPLLPRPWIEIFDLLECGVGASEDGVLSTAARAG